MAFFAFVDTLFVSLSGLMPGAGAAGTSRIFGFLGLVLSVWAGRALSRRRRLGEAPRTFLPLLFVAAVYAAQVVVSQVLLGSPGRGWAQNDLCATLMVLLVVGTLRSWELLGMGRASFTAAMGMRRPGAADERPGAAEETAH